MNKRGMSIIAVCVIAVFSVLIWIFFANEYKVRATFKDIKGVTVGSPLKYQGLKIGSVSEIKTGSDNKIILILEVDRDYTGYIREKALFAVSKDFFSDKPPEVLVGYCNDDKFENLAKLESGAEVTGEENKYVFGVKTKVGCFEKVLVKIPDTLNELTKDIGDILDSPEMKQLYGEIDKFAKDMSKLGNEQMQKFISEKGPHIRRQVERLIEELEQGGYKDKAKQWKEFLRQELDFTDFSVVLQELTREAEDFLKSPEMKRLYRELGKFAEDTSKLGHKQLQKYISENGPLIRKRTEELIKKLEQSGYKERAEQWKEFLEREFGLKD
ncbi:MAG: MCE family protein [Desulfobacteraceae bacterium]|nr:MCE family protein [Desulfobacteraceae bacterium]